MPQRGRRRPAFRLRSGCAQRASTIPTSGSAGRILNGQRPKPRSPRSREGRPCRRPRAPSVPSTCGSCSVRRVTPRNKNEPLRSVVTMASFGDPTGARVTVAPATGVAPVESTTTPAIEPGAGDWATDVRGPTCEGSIANVMPPRRSANLTVRSTVLFDLPSTTWALPSGARVPSRETGRAVRSAVQARVGRTENVACS